MMHLGRGRGHRTTALAATLAVTALVATACAQPSGRPVSNVPAAQGQQLWRSDGYGRIYARQGDTLTIYETTSISCIPGDTLSSSGTAGTDGGQTYADDDGDPDGTLTVGADGRATYHESGSVSTIDLTPVDTLPAGCDQKMSKDPLTTFDVFWTTFQENYNSLHRRNVDWVAMRDKYRPMVNAQTSHKELYDILRAMLQPLGDEHTGLTESGDDDGFEGERPGTVDISTKKTDRAVDAFLLAHGATNTQTFGGGKLVYADLPGNRGYLRIDAFEELGGKDDLFDRNEAEVKRMLDAVFTQARVAGLKMLILDVRNNPGGDDPLGIDIAARLTDRPYLAYTKAVRDDPNDPTKHGRAQPVQVTPAAGPRYSGPIRILTGPLTVSAGETFTLAMMGRTPSPQRFGESTQGVYSDTMDRTLPNGWAVTLGNEDFYGPDGRSYEGPGIPPTTRIPVFPPAELAAGQDSVLAAALR